MFVDQAKAQSRFDICKQCTFFNSTLARCSVCGCFMKVKVKLSGTSCPDGKWLAEVPQPGNQIDIEKEEVN
jgi:hypothetical protein